MVLKADEYVNKGLLTEESAATIMRVIESDLVRLYRFIFFVQKEPQHVLTVFGGYIPEASVA